MCHCDNLPAHVIIQSVDTVGVYEAVADPDSRFDRLVDFSHDVKRFLDPVLCHVLFVFPRLLHRLGAVFQYEEGLLSCDANQLSVLIPYHL